MENNTLSSRELVNLIKAVFPDYKKEESLGLLVDIPRQKELDNSAWQQRREIAWNWYSTLKDSTDLLELAEVKLIAYPDVGSNNADLPQEGYLIKEELPVLARDLTTYGEKISFANIFKTTQIFLAPTENSATAPLKNASKKYGFRAATMPGFSSSMLPALRIDYNEVYRRVKILKDKLDPATRAEVFLLVKNTREYKINFDLNYRLAHLSSGRFPDRGTAGNLPSGETYIVPYEGEKEKTSETNGILPVQIGKSILYFTIRENKAVGVEGEGEIWKKEADFLLREPAYGNMAELGFGVLGDFGLSPINEILLDEKLGFHIAFGRSDHFGGAVAPTHFTCPENVIHLDRIYIPATQPDILVKSIVLTSDTGEKEEIIRNGKYLIF